MKEIVFVKLDNEMDIILAHKRAMKMAELSGCSLVSQTTLATAISEISRVAVEFGKNSSLTFYIESISNRKFLRAEIKDTTDFCANNQEALTYAKRLIGDVQVIRKPKEFTIALRFQLSFSGTLSDLKIISIKDYFEKEPPLSAYDELRRKNQQLQDLADKIRETENEYKVLSDTLPLMMFSVNNRGQVTFANQWLQNFMGSVPKDLQPGSWQSYLWQMDFSAFSKDMQAMHNTQSPLSGQYRLKEKASGTYLWHMVSIIPLKNDKEIITGWIGFLVDIHAQKLIEQTLKDNKELKTTQQQLFEYQGELERKVVELNRSNYELEQFAHLASHDLQEPLRKLFFYSDVLRKKYSAALDESGLTILNSMAHAASRMRELIQDLLSYSQLHQQKLPMEEVNLNTIMNDILRDLEVNIKDKEATINIGELPELEGNPLRLRQLFGNLISNSLKYTRPHVKPVVDVLAVQEDDTVVVKIRDNGIGFDQQYSEKIFGLFERLHSRDQFPGTGIGLSICKKIAELHNGQISATAKENEFSLFEVRLPLHQHKVLVTPHE
jgi:PAS domain S-box-containing protein